MSTLESDTAMPDSLSNHTPPLRSMEAEDFSVLVRTKYHMISVIHRSPLAPHH